MRLTLAKNKQDSGLMAPVTAHVMARYGPVLRPRYGPATDTATIIREVTFKGAREKKAWTCMPKVDLEGGVPKSAQL
jgi:hypothetical protein